MKIQRKTTTTRNPPEKTREKTREKIIKLIAEDNKITIEELAEKTGITKKGVEWNIQKLKQKNLLKRTGPDKGGRWEIIR